MASQNHAQPELCRKSKYEIDLRFGLLAYVSTSFQQFHLERKPIYELRQIPRDGNQKHSFQGPIAGLAGGEELASSTGETFEVKDPGSGEKLAEVHNLQAEDVDRAVELAGQAFGNAEWTGLPVNERCVYLHRLADEVENRKPLISHLESMDCGKILGQAEDDVQNFIDTMRYFADLAQNMQLRTVLAVKGHEAAYARHPWGVCGSIVPWNFPFLLCGWGIAPALAAGNTVVVKPAEDTPLTTLYLAVWLRKLVFRTA